VICPHCKIGVQINFKDYTIISYKWENDDNGSGYELKNGLCPVCGELIVILTEGKLYYSSNGLEIYDYSHEQVLYPKFKNTRELPSEVQGIYRRDFMEACEVLEISPKASAAIGRRLLQHLLREEFNIKRNNLIKEIEEFISRPDVPSYLVISVDAVRNIGNFAAHPQKSINTGEILDVEYGEAEWLLEVLEALFDFALVQPKKLIERRNKLNGKLKELGKPEMK
jgi:hypothetical protein